MVQVGKYQVGFLINENNENDLKIDTNLIAIYKDQKVLCTFTKEDAIEVAQLMNSWLGLNTVNELADNEIFKELKERGYSGKLTLTKNIDI